MPFPNRTTPSSPLGFFRNSSFGHILEKKYLFYTNILKIIVNQIQKNEQNDYLKILTVKFEK